MPNSTKNKKVQSIWSVVVRPDVISIKNPLMARKKAAITPVRFEKSSLPIKNVNKTDNKESSTDGNLMASSLAPNTLIAPAIIHKAIGGLCSQIWLFVHCW